MNYEKISDFLGARRRALQYNLFLGSLCRHVTMLLFLTPEKNYESSHFRPLARPVSRSRLSQQHPNQSRRSELVYLEPAAESSLREAASTSKCVVEEQMGMSRCGRFVLRVVRDR